MGVSDYDGGIMTARIIDGTALARRLRQDIAARVDTLKAAGVTPGLAVILIGEDAASAVYVGRKIKACEAVGIRSFTERYPETIDTAALLARIAALNADPAVHGILVQLPLPAHIDMPRVLETISIDKDVDGFHLYNIGALVTGNTVFSPCTPYGVVKLLESEGIDLKGQNVVVVGASNIVGKPTALMLMAEGATVSICHIHTRDLAQYTIMADILVVAAGVPGLIVAQMVKRGAVVIDVGINRLPDGKLTGDVEFGAALQRAGAITPVPKGVGPMTIAYLLANTWRSFGQRHGIHPA